MFIISTNISNREVLEYRYLQKQITHGFYRHIQFSRQASGKKGQKLLNSLNQKQSCILNQIHPKQKDKIGGYRFINNDRVTEQLLINSLQMQCKENCRNQQIICLQDTTEYNFQHHLERLDEGTLGLVGNNIDVGFFCHPMLCFDAKSSLPLGISFAKLWSRNPARKNKKQREYKKLPIEEKESYRWIDAIETTKHLLSNNITFISDRESDIYQLWSRVPDSKTDLIIRCRKDRKLYDQSKTILQSLEDQKILGEYSIDLKANKKKSRSKRKTILQVKSIKVKIKKPHSAISNSQQDPEYVELFAVEAKEDRKRVPENEMPVHWLLLTTHKIKSFTKAKEILTWYSFRWQIEQFFRITKKQGLDFESSQLETGDGLKKLALLSFATALKILQLTLARDLKVHILAHNFFSTKEIIILNAINNKIKGETNKQINPNKKHTLAWVAWIIARLGSWSGYESQGPPGPITYKRGYDEFRSIMIGFDIVRDVYKE